jgi:hypothetical protein
MRTLLILFLAAFAAACSKKEANRETRSFYMGITPWPADFTFEEVGRSYEFINQYCDIVSHHFDDGIPYEEFFRGQSLPTGFLQDVQTRKNKTAAAKKVFLSVSALNLTRREKADYYANATTDAATKNKWKSLPVNHPDVIDAYVKYINWLISEFQPLYVNYGVESNVSLWNIDSFGLYKDFLSKTYSLLKSQHPSIPFFISFIVDESTEGFSYASQLTAFTDFIGLSAYPYVTISSSANGNTDPALFPSNYFERFIQLAPAKPLAFAETGYIAESLMIPAFNLSKQGNQQWQNDYLQLILELCHKKQAKLLVWFCHKDYDAGNARLRSLGLYQDLFGLWEDTGLTDENGNHRKAFDTWVGWVGRERK